MFSFLQFDLNRTKYLYSSTDLLRIMAKKKVEVDIGPRAGKHADRVMKAVWIIVGIAAVAIIFSLIMMFLVFKKLPF